MDHPYGALSLLPPLAAILLAIATRRVILSLLAGVFVGALILAGGDPFAAVRQTLEYHLWQTLIEPDKLAVFAFTLMMGAMSGIVQSNGGMNALVGASTRFTSTRRRGQLLTWALGLVIFFDDYANTILLGQTMRPVADRLRISREKLAYLVDSTAAPVAGLALVSTWVAGEISYIKEGIDAAGWDKNVTEVEAFLQSVPYRFYVLLTLFLGLVVCLWNRDFPAMSRAERRAIENPHEPDASDADAIEDPDATTSTSRAHWFHAIGPIAITVGAILFEMYRSGRANCIEADDNLTWMNIFGNCDSYRSLLWGSVAGLAVAWLWTWGARLLSWERIAEAAGRGAKLTLPALAALWLAGSISNMTKNEPLAPAGGFPESSIVGGESSAVGASAAEASNAYPFASHSLYAGKYLESVLNWIVGGPEHAGSAAWALPTIVFVAAAGMSFATGTSWGTMALLMPLALSLCAGAAGGSFDVSQSTVLYAVVGSVLAGAIFGDHCSPISDTTILSSQASGCEPIAHVRTQMPYALVAGALSILCGTLPAGFGLSPYLSLGLGALGAVLALFVLGRRNQPE